MDADAIERGLAAHGVPTFAERPPADAPKPPLDELIRACVESGEPRYKSAVIPLIIALGNEAGEPLRRVEDRLAPEHARWLRWLTRAAGCLERAYRSDLAFLLGRSVVGPASDVDRDEAEIRALVAEIEGIEGDVVNWRRSVEDPVRGWLNQLWHERRVARAKAGHAGAA